MQIGVSKEIGKPTFRVLALRWSESRNYLLCVVLIQTLEHRYWLMHGKVKKQQNK